LPGLNGDGAAAAVHPRNGDFAQYSAKTFLCGASQELNNTTANIADFVFSSLIVFVQ